LKNLNILIGESKHACLISNALFDNLWRSFRYKAPFTAKAWMDKFKHVVGIIHTNYLSYTRADSLGQIKEPLVYYINQGTHTQTICFVSARATFLLFHNPITSIWQHTTHIYYLQGYAVRIATKSSNCLVRCKNLLLRKK